MSNGYWGYHAMFDCSECDLEAITNPDTIYDFIQELVEQIDMTAYGQPVIAHFATHDPTKAGYSFIQMIETSNISGHLVDSSGDGYIDVFSCKPFSTSTVEDVIDKYFNPKKVRLNFVTRSAG